MTDRPILFSAPMVRAILEGRKTQTRRVVKDLAKVQARNARGESAYPYGQPGDRLWVREPWRGPVDNDSRAPRDLAHNVPIWYAADNGKRFITNAGKPGKTRVSLHMPRWASRISLEVTGVRVEQLWKIDDDDARAEGVYPTATGLYAPGQFIGEYAKLWDQINAKRAPWASNPWVWVVEFKRLP